MDSLLMGIHTAWRITERREWTADSEEDLAEELNSRASEATLWITVFEPVSGLWAQNTECMSADLSVESHFWNYCKCSVFIINSFNCFICSVNKRRYLLSPGPICYSNNYLQPMLQMYETTYTKIKWQPKQPLKLKKILKSPIPKDSYGYNEISTKLLKLSSPFIRSP